MKELKEKIINTFKSYGIDNPKIKYTYNYTLIGGCDRKGTIYLSLPSLTYNTDDGIKSIVAHEIAHLTHFNHSADFKKLERGMGYRENDIIRISKYIIYCPRCSAVGRLNVVTKKIKEKLICKRCKTNHNINQKLMIYKHVMEE
jgi:predicted SprT family Zn-dependent metalloprotease